MHVVFLRVKCVVLQRTRSSILIVGRVSDIRKWTFAILFRPFNFHVHTYVLFIKFSNLERSLMTDIPYITFIIYICILKWKPSSLLHCILTHVIRIDINCSSSLCYNLYVLTILFFVIYNKWPFQFKYVLDYFIVVLYTHLPSNRAKH
jgi:hypothetical protein